jgi:hypothetical protein
VRSMNIDHYGHLFGLVYVQRSKISVR